MTSLQKLTYKNIIAIALLCVVGLGTFYSYRLIESYKFMVERVEETPRTKYLREFGLDNLESTLLIRDILVSTRQEIKANQVSV